MCLRLGLTPLTYLWQRDQSELLGDMIEASMESVLVKVACLGLERKHLGQSLAMMRPELERLADKYGANVCGEGGEYETFTLDCPLFRHRLVISFSEVINHSDDAFAPVHLLNIKCELQSKGDQYLKMTHREMLETVKIGDETLLDKISPLQFCSDHASMENVKVKDVSEIKNLDFTKETDNFKFKQNGWFQVTSFGHSEDNAECVREAFSSLESLLTSHDFSLPDVAKIVMYIDSMDNYAEMNKQYASYFGLNPPVRVCVGVDRSVLSSGCRILLVSTGVKRDSERRYLHVQV